MNKLSAAKLSLDLQPNQSFVLEEFCVRACILEVCLSTQQPYGMCITSSVLTSTLKVTGCAKLAATIAFRQSTADWFLQPTGGAAPAAGAQRDVTVEEHITKFAGRMGNIVASSMAGGFGASLGSRAAHSVWNGMTGRR